MPSFESCVKKTEITWSLYFLNGLALKEILGIQKKNKKIDKSGLVVEIFQSINECKQHGYTNVY